MAMMSVWQSAVYDYVRAAYDYVGTAKLRYAFSLVQSVT